MIVRRLRSGELLALAGLIVMIVSLLEPWYRAPSGNVDAWDTFGPAVVLLLIDAVAAAALLLSALGERTPALPVFAAVWTVPIGVIGVIAALVRVLERPDAATGLCAGAWLAIAGALLIVIAGWQTLRDEHAPLYGPPVLAATEIESGDLG
jgi:hypothetical protein